MANNCPFCKHLQQSIDNDKYYAEQARKNGRTGIDRYTDKYVAALAHETYFDGEFSGRTTAYFDALNFCPICGADLREIQTR